MSVSDFLKKHKVTIGVVGTTLVLGTTYGTCQLTSAPSVEETPVEEGAVEEPDEPASDEEALNEAPSEEPSVEE